MAVRYTAATEGPRTQIPPGVPTGTGTLVGSPTVTSP